MKAISIYSQHCRVDFSKNIQYPIYAKARLAIYFLQRHYKPAIFATVQSVNSGFFLYRFRGLEMADRYYTVLDFMVSELQLKGLERDIYAIIYGFCQAGRTYTGSLQYLADWTLTTKQGVIKVLKKLEEKGLLIKEEKIINNVKFNEYKTVRPEVNSSQLSLPVCNIGDIDSQHSLTGVVNRVERGSQQSLPNNKDINKGDNKEDNLLTGFDLNKEEKERLSGALSDFSEMRKKIKKPLTNRA